MDRHMKEPPGGDDRGATQLSGGGPPRGTVALDTTPHPADVSDELGELATLMRAPGLLTEPEGG